MRQEFTHPAGIGTTTTTNNNNTSGGRNVERGNSFYVRRSVRSVVLFVLTVQEERKRQKLSVIVSRLNLFYIRQHTLQTAATTAERRGNNHSVVIIAHVDADEGPEYTKPTTKVDKVV